MTESNGLRTGSSTDFSDSALNQRVKPDGMRRPVSRGMRYAPKVRRAQGTKKRRPAMQKISTVKTKGKRF